MFAVAVYIALLRGINVGGHKLIKMTDLKQMAEGLGLGHVQTYIQSGNLVFTADDTEEAVRRTLEQRIEAVFGFSVPTVVRTAPDFQRILDQSPYAPGTLAEGEDLHVALLGAVPDQKGIDRLMAVPPGIDECKVVGREVYLLCRQGLRNTPYAVLEKKLGVPATMRNWQTMTRLAAMAADMAG